METTSPPPYPFVKIPPGGKKELAQIKIVAPSHLLPPPSNFKSFWQETRRLSLLLAGLEILSYCLVQNFSASNSFLLLLSPLSLFIQIIVFAFWSAKFLRQRAVRKSFLVPLFGSFATGLVFAIFLFLWHHQIWTIYNLILEPLWWSARALIVSIIINIINKIYQLLTFKKLNHSSSSFNQI